jgi:hypothetical protein
MKIKIICAACNLQVEKDHWNVIDNKPSFCSSICSNSRHHRWKGHIKKTLHCLTCGIPIDLRGKTKTCSNCYFTTVKSRIEKITVGELKSKYKRKKNPWYSAEIRKFCRTYNPDLVNTPCQKCGYSRYTELCHIKPISSFVDSSTIKEINDRNNIIVLCPTHHWEFDHGFLKIGSLAGN